MRRPSTRLPWAERGWALPFLTVLAPSARDYHPRGRQPQARLDRARQAVWLVRRWLPTRELVVVGDSPYAALEWLDAVRERACVITRWRLHAALYAPAPRRTPRPKGRPRKQGTRLPTLAQRVADQATCWKMVQSAPCYGQEARWVHITSATAVWYHSGLPAVPMRWALIRDPAGQCAPPALLSTTLVLDPGQLLTWFVPRGQLDTTFEEARTHLGLETSRPCNDQSTRRTTPAFFGLYAIVTLAAAHLRGHQPVSVRTTAWYPKQQATVSDPIASVRWALWRADRFSIAGAQTEVVKIPQSLFERLTEPRFSSALGISTMSGFAGDMSQWVEVHKGGRTTAIASATGGWTGRDYTA